MILFLLLSKEEMECSNYIRRVMSNSNSNLTNAEIVEKIFNILMKTKANTEFIDVFAKKYKK